MTEPGALPAYLQISERLIRDIAAGRLTHGQRLPAERSMAADHGVSVVTLRKALAELAARDLLDRRQGSGNYIRASGKPAGVYAFFRLELTAGTGFPTARVLDLARVTKPTDIPLIGPGPDAWRIRRLRWLDATPVSVEEIWLDGRFSDKLTPADLSQSLYLHYREILGLWVERAEDRIGLGHVPVWSPDAFPLNAETPCGLVERRAWDQHDQPAEFSRSWFDSTCARYVARIN